MTLLERHTHTHFNEFGTRVFFAKECSSIANAPPRIEILSFFLHSSGWSRLGQGPVPKHSWNAGQILKPIVWSCAHPSKQVESSKTIGHVNSEYIRIHFLGSFRASLCIALRQPAWTSIPRGLLETVYKEEVVRPYLQNSTIRIETTSYFAGM